MIIVIDGPAGSGKSSTAKAVAENLGIQYLDSGALYRVAVLVYLQTDCIRTLFLERLKESEILFNFKNRKFRISLNGADVTDEIRKMEVSQKVSEVAAIPEVRHFVNNLMHKAVSEGVFIADGRDLGTAVFPEADLKFFMVADLEERAQRRFAELTAAGGKTTLREVKANIAARDRIDSSRATDPLKQAEDAILIDTSKLTFEEQISLVGKHIKKVLHKEHN